MLFRNKSSLERFSTLRVSKLLANKDLLELLQRLCISRLPSPNDFSE